MQKLIFLVLLLVSTTAFADVTMTFSDGSFVKINERYVAIGDDYGFGIIEDGKDTFIMVDHGERSYMEVSATFADDVSAMMAAQMEQMLADVPPEQRAMIEQSMKGMMPGGGAMPEPPKMMVRKTGDTDSVAGYKCSEVEISYGTGQAEEMSCVATTSELGISGRDFASMAAAMRAISRMAGMDGEDDTLVDFEAMGGIPIRTRDLPAGDAEELVSLSKDDLDDSDFAVPDSYTKVSMEDMMMQ